LDDPTHGRAGVERQRSNTFLNIACALTGAEFDDAKVGETARDERILFDDRRVAAARASRRPRIVGLPAL